MSGPNTDDFYSNNTRNDFEEIEKKWVLSENPHKSHSELVALREERKNRYSRHSNKREALWSQARPKEDQSLAQRDCSAGLSARSKLEMSREKRKKSPIFNTTGEMLNLTDFKIRDLEAKWDSLKKSRCRSENTYEEKSPDFKNQPEKERNSVEKSDLEEKRNSFFGMEVMLEDQNGQVDCVEEFALQEQMRMEISRKMFESESFSERKKKNLHLNALGPTDKLESFQETRLKQKLVQVQWTSFTPYSSGTAQEPQTHEWSEREEARALEPPHKTSSYSIDNLPCKPLFKTLNLGNIDVIKNQQNNKRPLTAEKRRRSPTRNEAQKQKEIVASTSPIRGYLAKINKAKPSVYKDKRPESSRDSAREKMRILEKKQQQVQVFRKMIDKIQKDIETERKGLESSKEPRGKESKSYYSAKKLEANKGDTNYIEQFLQQQMINTPSWPNEKQKEMNEMKQKQLKNQKKFPADNKGKGNPEVGRHGGRSGQKDNETRSKSPIFEPKNGTGLRSERKEQTEKDKENTGKEEGSKGRNILSDRPSNYGELLKNYQKLKQKSTEERIKNQRKVSKSPVTGKKEEKIGVNNTKEYPNPKKMEKSRSPDKECNRTSFIRKSVVRTYKQKSWLVNK